MATLAPDLVHPNAVQTETDLRQRFRAVRQYSRDLVEPLSPEDACVQSMPDASPAKWHLAHVTWFFETFVLETYEPGFKPHHHAFRELFNSYYNGIGKQFSRPDRGMITRPSLGEVLEYRSAVEERVEALLEKPQPNLVTLIELGLQHEQQHQELLLMDIKHLLSINPLSPAYLARELPAAPTCASRWVEYDGGLVEVGAGNEAFHFDNETPRHRFWLEPFKLGSRLITNADYLEFIDDDGYRQPLLWLADGLAQVHEQGWSGPAYWRKRDDAWFEFTLHGEVPLAANAPVCHLSFYEADAYAQWAGARLPSESEWETALSEHYGRAAHTSRLHPPGAGDGDAISGVDDSLWQWTRSAYLPYPGFTPAAGAVGEYNGKFMSNQMVLKGGACITPAGHARGTYRNFFYTHQRWPFTGLRLARDA